MTQLASANFQAAFERLLGNEGAYVDNPADPGGATMWGITERVARSWGYDGDMRALPRATAEAIAYNRYWQPHQLDALPAAVGFQVFDAVYNGGPAILWLQRAAGMPADLQDGTMGPKTLAAAVDVVPAQLIARFNAQRLLYLASLDAWPTFGRGWARRIANNLLVGEA
ncbi:MAG: glycoside hydrolase family 108 protein [Rhodospirillales bacterium]|nr:glycoside hydrolase family 108 protein [Rhodospirillales bacterium]